jgi:lipoate-protein ligase A
VRRSSGGGAILHDRELTYSLAVPRSYSGARHADDLYRAIHGSLIEALADLGVNAALFENASGTSAKLPAEPFLCFKRRSPGDVLIRNTKIAGSAQRRRRGAVLEHGSLLLAKSNFAPELMGLAELTGEPGLGAKLPAVWLKRLEHRLEVTFTEQLPPPEIVANARRIAAEKFATTAWTQKK